MLFDEINRANENCQGNFSSCSAISRIFCLLTDASVFRCQGALSRSWMADSEKNIFVLKSIMAIRKNKHRSVPYVRIARPKSFRAIKFWVSMNIRALLQFHDFFKKNWSFVLALWSAWPDLENRKSEIFIKHEDIRFRNNHYL